MKKVFALLVGMICCFVFLTGGIIGSAAESYEPNRSITMRSDTVDNPIIQMEFVPLQLGENGGPYHIAGKMNIADFGKIDASKPAAISIVAYYGNYNGSTMKDPDETLTLAEWTDKTNGWVDIRDFNNNNLEIKDFDTDVIIRIQMINVKGSIEIGDLIVADSKDEIVYSLANDPQFLGITSYWTKLGADHVWRPYNIGNGATVDVKIKEYDYTPNDVVKLIINPNAAGSDQPFHAYMSTNFTANFTADKAPLTLRGMIKVEKFEVAQNSQEDTRFKGLSRFFTGHSMARIYTGDTGGWVPLLDEKGKPFVMNTIADFQNIFGSWGSTGEFSLADLEIFDKDGNVVYTFGTDASLAEGDMALATGKTFFNFWYNFQGGAGGKYNFTKSATPVEHTADQYKMKTFVEKYEAPKAEPPKEDGEGDDDDNNNGNGGNQNPPQTSTGSSILVILACAAISFVGIRIVKTVKAN